MIRQVWPFGEIRPLCHSVIMADPPWDWTAYSDKGLGRSPEAHYRTMPVSEIKALPVQDLAAKDCVLFLWTTSPHLPDALDVMQSWGFRYVGKAFCWAKNTLQADRKPRPDLGIGHDYNWKLGPGYTSRANTEDCLLGTIGSPSRLSAGVRELIVAPTREHSRKPDEAYERAERLYPGPYLELFSRQTRPGWQSWGNEIGKFDKEGV